MEKTDFDKLFIYGTFIGNSNEESHFSFGVTTSVVKATGGREVSLDCDIADSSLDGIVISGTSGTTSALKLTCCISEKSLTTRRKTLPSLFEGSAGCKSVSGGVIDANPLNDFLIRTI